jgi:DNA helicase HerA-like ATPase
MKLKISEDLLLPIDAVTQTFAILAKRGSGKSYLASVMAEEMLKENQVVIALDPTGAWWGLRSGFPIAVLGGEHGDVQLQESAGEVIAQAVVENRFSAVLDLSLFRKGQMIRFMVTFLETLYRLNRDPVHLFVDEADSFAPQGRTYGGDENRMLGAMEDLVRRGRKRGVGCSLITQRPAVLNKNVLSQCESVFALRMVHPRDIEALKEWIDVHADPAVSREVIDSLPSLPIGTAWFWSPGWMGTLKRIQVRRRETFDSSATPKPGEAARQPRTMAKIDLSNRRFDSRD